MTGMKRLWDNGNLAIVQGAGIPIQSQPLYFEWNTGIRRRPNAVESRGWGDASRRAMESSTAGDHRDIALRQSLAVQSSLACADFVFSDPACLCVPAIPRRSRCTRRFWVTPSASGQQDAVVPGAIFRDPPTAARRKFARLSPLIAPPFPTAPQSSVSTLSTD